MILFLINLCLAFLAAALVGSVKPAVLAAGFLAGYLALWLLRPIFVRRSRYFKVLPKATLYTLYVLWELVVSSVRVAIVVLSPCPKMSPGIAAVPLRLKDDRAIFILANSITLTPGTISLLVSEDKKTLFVHGMFIGNASDFKKSIHESFEKKIMEFMN